MAPYVGYFAAFLGIVCWIPQTWRAWSTRDTSGLSLAANLLFLLTVGSWLAYGLMVADWPLIVANFCTSLIVVSIIVAKLKFK